ncbi:MAG: hypothetical protein JWO62_2617 [Acidimicrobiaceae bacterium]|nr:hypothetical protein [Acidimicrobiaceae bacterium]
MLRIEAPPDKVRRLAELQRLKAEQKRQRSEKYASDPVGFITDRLGEIAWSKQAEIIESVRDHRRTAVRSCHAIGKSHIASRTAAWWLDSWPAGEAFVVSTAPTFEQVRAVLWRYIGQVHRKAGLQGRVNQTEWWIGEEFVGFGRKPADTNEAAFQGIHARRVLVILDEACGIPRQLWLAANSLAANEDSRILAIGNPDDPQSYFAAVSTPDSGWHQIAVSAFDTPNFTGEVVPPEVAAELIGPIYVEEMAKDCGPESGPYLSKVLGQFAPDSDDGVVLLSAVRACQHAEPVEYDDDELLPIELGWDVGAGGDKSVVRERCGVRAGRVWYPKGADTMAQCGEVLEIIAETGATAIKIDTIGIGHGAGDRMAELGREGAHDADVVRVNVGESSTRPERFPKLRDQLWWEVGRRLSTDHAWDLSACDEATVAQLTAPKYALDSSGRIKVEPKAETKKRLGRSPDEADALLLAFHHRSKRKGARMTYAGRAR